MVHLESVLSEGQNTEVIKEIDTRLLYMQEDQKRARDVLESSMLEQLRIEHSTLHSQSAQMREQWEREMKARQAYQENYKELLSQERSAREAAEGMLQHRLQEIDRASSSDVQLIWKAIESSRTLLPVKAPPTTTVVERVPIVEKVVAPPMPIIEKIVQPSTIMSPRGSIKFTTTTTSGPILTPAMPSYTPVAPSYTPVARMVSTPSSLTVSPGGLNIDMKTSRASSSSRRLH
jgi:hypothetical protein